MIDSNGHRYNSDGGSLVVVDIVVTIMVVMVRMVLAVGVMLPGRDCKLVIEGMVVRMMMVMEDDGGGEDGGGHEDKSAGVMVVMVLVIDDGCYSPKAVRC